MWLNFSCNSLNTDDMAEKSSVFAFWQEQERKIGLDEIPKPTRTSPLTKRLIKTMESNKQPLDHKQKERHVVMNTKATSYKSLPGNNVRSSKSSLCVSDNNLPSDLAPRSLNRNRPHSVMILSRRFETQFETTSHLSPDQSPEARHKRIQFSDTKTDKLNLKEPVSFETTKSAPPPIHNGDHVARVVINSKLRNKSETTKSDSRSCSNKLHHQVSETSDTIRSVPSTLNIRNHVSKLDSNSSPQSFDSIKSAPPTIDNRKHNFSWKSKESKSPLQSSGSFISYLEDITDNDDNYVS